MTRVLAPGSRAWLVAAALIAAGCQGESPLSPGVSPPGVGQSARGPASGRVEELRSSFGAALAARGEDMELRDGRLRPAVASGQRSAEVSLPATTRGAFTLKDVRSSMSVDVSLAGAADAPAAVEGGLVLYRGGYGGVADVLHRVGGGGTEDFVAFEREPAVRELSYGVTLGNDVAGLRQVEGTLELLDAGGAPRLRMAAPYVVDGVGERHAAWVTVEGCAVDADLRMPWGRPVTAPGAAVCTVRVGWDGGLTYPLLVDPVWSTTTSMQGLHADHTSTTLGSGRVLVAGSGWPAMTVFCTGESGPFAETFDPTTATWAATGALPGNPTSQQQPSSHTATLLANGKVLVAGGTTLANGYQAAAYLYDPSTGSWTATGSLATARTSYTATLLPDGTVLAAGGTTTSNEHTLAGERYDPSTGAWSAAGTMNVGRDHHTASLTGGKVVLVGGTTSTGSIDIFDPSFNAWTLGPSLATARASHTATVLTDGRILVAGGLTNGCCIGGDVVTLSSVEIYDPVAAAWSAGASMAKARLSHTATLLGNGKVLVAGGMQESFVGAAFGIVSATEWYDPTAGTWSDATIAYPTFDQAASLLSDGRVLMTGGGAIDTLCGGVNGASPTSTAMLFSAGGSANGAACTQNAQCASSECVSGVCCNSACAGGCGTCTAAGSVGTCTAIAAGSAGSPSCAPMVCNGGTSCPATCTANTDCVSGRVCHDGTCTFASAPVAWQGGQDVDASGGTLANGYGCPGWTSGAYSTQIVSGDGYVEFDAGETTTSRMAGISAGNWTADFTHLGFAFLLSSNGSVYVYESGVFQAGIGTYAVGDRFDVAVTSGVVSYRQNGVTVHTSAAAAPAQWDADAVLYDCGATVGSATIAGAAPLPSPIPTQSVAWSQTSGVSVSGSNLTETNASCPAWGAGAASSGQRLPSGDGYVQVTASETTTVRMVGLGQVSTWSVSRAGAAAYDQIDYAAYLYQTELYVSEAGALVADLGPYATGDVIRVAIESGKVVYRKNGALLYTSAGAPPVYPLQVEAEIYTCGGTLNGATISGASLEQSVSWSPSAGVSVSADDLTETNASCPAWGAGAASSSQQLVSGDGYVEVMASETTTRRMVGLGQVGAWSVSQAGAGAYDQIDYAAYLYLTELYVSEAGALVADLGPYATGDVIRVAIESGKVVYRKNGALLYTSTGAPPAYPLQAEAEIYDCGGTVNGATISAVSATPVDWQGMFGTATHSFSSLAKSGAAGWDSGASSRQMLVDAAGCAYGVQRCYVQATATGATQRMFGLSHTSNAQSPNIDFGLETLANGSLVVMEGGVSRGTVASYAAGDTLAVGIENGTVLYSKNGNNVYVSTVTPQFPLFAQAQLHDTNATLSNVVMSGALQANVTWTAETGTSSDGSTLAKTDPTSAWSAQATATVAIASSDGYVEFGVAETNTWRMAGLTSHETTASYTDIGWAFYLAGDGSLHVYESGAYIGTFGTYTIGDRLRVAVENGAMVYRKNGTLLYTSTTAPTLPLSVDDSLFTPGATLSDVTIAGRLQ